VARTGSVARTGASSARRLLGRTPGAVVVGGAASALVGLGIYALLRRRVPFAATAQAARARFSRARRARAYRERMLMEEAGMARARRAHGRRR
jgi:hypothetical protein